MSERQIKLSIISGLEAGMSYDLKGPMVVGRDAGCDIVLSDTAISSKHARLTISPVPRVTDLGSANHTYVNNKPVASVDLKSGDVILFASTAARIEIRDIAVEMKEKQAKTRKLVLYTVIALMVVGIGGMLFWMQSQQEKARLQAPLGATGLSGKVEFPGVKTSFFPLPGEFDPPVPSEAITRYVTPWWLLPVMPANRGELELSRVLPPDPPERQYLRTRRWAERPPKLGGRRIILGATPRQTLVLGSYRSVEWQFSLVERADLTPLNFTFMLQSWDGLPRGADVSWVGLNRGAWENGKETDNPAVPRRYNFLVPDTLWDERSERLQSAHVSVTKERNLYIQFHKVGEMLYILTFDYPLAQKSRLEGVAQALLKGQSLPGRSRPQTEQEIYEIADLLEKEGDMFLPDMTGWGFDDFERHDKKMDFFRASSRYLKAMEYRQSVGDWLNSPRYETLVGKILLLYNYTENKNSLFQRLFWQIEDDIATHRERRSGLARVKENLATLHRITYEGTDMQTQVTLNNGKTHMIPLMPDEWMMYTHLRNIVVKEME